MRVSGMFRKFRPIAVLAVAVGLSGCDRVEVNFNGEDGVPLAALDLSGDPPDSLALAGPDDVVVTTGDEFTIAVEGSDAATERMRFVLSDGTLAITRTDSRSNDNESATVNITMPAPSEIAVLGSGRVTADTMSSDSEIRIAGSGAANISEIDSDQLEIEIAGSGRAVVAGSTERLEIDILGSGTADLAGLQADQAEVNIAGSGDVSFASDGTVEASIAGSGDVRVRGSASCTLDSTGSGRLICEEADVAADDEDDSTE